MLYKQNTFFITESLFYRDLNVTNVQCCNLYTKLDNMKRVKDKNKLFHVQNF